MGDQQAHRKADEQVAGRGRRRSRAAARTDRLVAWREERSSRQVFVKNGLVFGGNNCL